MLEDITLNIWIARQNRNPDERFGKFTCAQVGTKSWCQKDRGTIPSAVVEELLADNRRLVACHHNGGHQVKAPRAFVSLQSIQALGARLPVAFWRWTPAGLGTFSLRNRSEQTFKAVATNAVSAQSWRRTVNTNNVVNAIEQITCLLTVSRRIGK